MLGMTMTSAKEWSRLRHPNQFRLLWRGREARQHDRKSTGAKSFVRGTALAAFPRVAGPGLEEVVQPVCFLSLGCGLLHHRPALSSERGLSISI